MSACIHSHAQSYSLVSNNEDQFFLIDEVAIKVIKYYFNNLTRPFSFVGCLSVFLILIAEFTKVT